MPSAPRIQPYLGLGLGILAVSTSALFINFALADGAPALVVAAYRLSLAALILLPLVIARHRPELARLSRRQLGLALVSGVFLSLHFATWVSSLAYTSVASSVLLVDTAPLFVALIATFALKEAPSAAMWAGLIVALAGAVVVTLSDACAAGACPPAVEMVRGRALIGDALAVVGAIAVAVYIVIGRQLRASVSLTTYIFLTYGTAAVSLCLIVLLARLPVAGFKPTAYLWFGLLALIPQLIGHTAYNWALKYLPATLVSLTVLAEPIGSTVLALFFLRQVPSGLKIFGGALTLAGILLASRHQAELE